MDCKRQENGFGIEALPYGIVWADSRVRYGLRLPIADPEVIHNYSVYSVDSGAVAIFFGELEDRGAMLRGDGMIPQFRNCGVEWRGRNVSNMHLVARGVLRA